MWKISILVLASITLCAQPEIDRVLYLYTDPTSISAEELDQRKELLTYHLNHPIDLGAGDVHQLADHPLISFGEAVNIAMYIEKSGRPLDWYELTEVSGIDREWIELRKPFFSIRPLSSKIKWRLTIPRGKFAVLYSPDDLRKKGYRRGEYLGTTTGLNGRLQVSSGAFSIGYRFQKDRGETWLPFENGLVDHHSFFIQWVPNRKMQIALGDYRVSHHLGMTTGGGFGSAIYQNFQSFHTQIEQPRATATAAEFGTYRGGLIHLRYGKSTIVAHAGYNIVDGRWEGEILDGLYTSGLHRTISELDQRNNTRCYSVGGSYLYTHHQWRAGYAVQRLRYTGPGKSDFGSHSLFAQWSSNSLHMESEFSTDATLNWGGRIKLSRSFESVQIGIDHYVSHPHFQPDVLNAKGSFYSGGGERSTQAIIAFNIKGIAVTTSLFKAEQKQVEWRTKEKQGIQLSFLHGAYENKTECRYRITKSEGQLEHYAVFNHNLDRHSKSRITAATHFSRLQNPALLVAFSHQYAVFKWTAYSRLRVYQNAEYPHNLWMMQKSPPLTMGILTLTGSGFGIDQSLKRKIGERWEFQITGNAEYHKNVETSGSSLNEIESPWTWSTHVYMCYSFGKGR